MSTVFNLTQFENYLRTVSLNWITIKMKLIIITKYHSNMKISKGFKLLSNSTECNFQIEILTVSCFRIFFLFNFKYSLFEHYYIVRWNYRLWWEQKQNPMEFCAGFVFGCTFHSEKSSIMSHRQWAKIFWKMYWEC